MRRVFSVKTSNLPLSMQELVDKINRDSISLELREKTYNSFLKLCADLKDGSYDKSIEYHKWVLRRKRNLKQNTQSIKSN